MLRRRTDWTGWNEGTTQILIVDDDAEMRTVLKGTLRRLGYRVQETPDGLWVSRALQQGVFSFDLVVLEWKMPDLDGLAVPYELSLAILNEEIEHEAWFSEVLGEGPSGHFRRGAPGAWPYTARFLVVPEA